ncbi:MAG: hypothetical protein A2X64_03030 [Ignavibacteria bacterium GWF2_33_9]|nr:MAG: hypothetical protein A2X64_03030 [Ignavibacteria bacterium GWF2_33_9]
MNNRKTEILDWLYSLHRFGIQPGLERISNVLAKLGNPEKSLKAIHIAGTNGKGSTAVTISSILMEAGYTVGLYTSPHLVDFNERIQINGKLISDEKLVDIAEEMIPVQEETGATFFEFTTALAFKYFADEKVDFAVIEAGMGGKNDATNVLNPILSVITQISMEHTDYLGDTLEKIAEDKAGIIKENGKTLISDSTTELKDYFRKEGLLKNNIVKFLDEFFTIRSVEKDKREYNKISYGPVNGLHNLYFKTKWNSTHQYKNILAGIAAIKMLSNELKISENLIHKGTKLITRNFSFNGRFQILRKKPLRILDVAHNPDAFIALKKNLQRNYKSNEFTLVIALMDDKDIDAITSTMANIFLKIIVTKPKIDRAAKPERIRDSFIKNGEKSEIILTNSIQECIELTMADENPILFAGSFYLIGEVLKNLNPQ